MMGRRFPAFLLMVNMLCLLVMAACSATENFTEDDNRPAQNQNSNIQTAADLPKDIDEMASLSQGAFDFETRSVTLNSGYVMPVNGLGTYSLHSAIDPSGCPVLNSVFPQSAFCQNLWGKRKSRSPFDSGIHIQEQY